MEFVWDLKKKNSRSQIYANLLQSQNYTANSIGFLCTGTKICTNEQIVLLKKDTLLHITYCAVTNTPTILRSIFSACSVVLSVLVSFAHLLLFMTKVRHESTDVFNNDKRKIIFKLLSSYSAFILSHSWLYRPNSILEFLKWANCGEENLW